MAIPPPIEIPQRRGIAFRTNAQRASLAELPFCRRLSVIGCCQAGLPEEHAGLHSLWFCSFFLALFLFLSLFFFSFLFFFLFLATPFLARIPLPRKACEMAVLRLRATRPLPRRTWLSHSMAPEKETMRQPRQTALGLLGPVNLGCRFFFSFCGSTYTCDWLETSTT